MENKVKQEDEHDNDNDMTTEENFNFKFKNQQEKRTPSPQHIKLKLPMSALAPTSFDLTDRDAVRQLMSNQRHHMRQLDTGMYKKTGFKLWAQSFTSLMADLHQDINRVTSFSRCINGTCS